MEGELCQEGIFLEETIDEYKNLILDQDLDDSMQPELGLSFIFATRVATKLESIAVGNRVNYRDLSVEFLGKSVHEVQYHEDIIITPKDIASLSFYSHVTGLENIEDSEKRKVYTEIFNRFDSS